MNDLPPGFELDADPVAAAAPSGALPPGFEIDAPAAPAASTPPMKPVIRYGRQVWPPKWMQEPGGIEKFQELTRKDEPTAPTPPARPKNAGFDTDTGMNVPEGLPTLLEQQRAVVEGRRQAVMFPKGSHEPALQPGLARMETPRGIFHFDPLKTTPQAIRRLSRDNRENEILGLGPYNKQDIAQRAASGEPVIAITERRPDGTEVKAAVGTPSTAPEQLAAIAAGAAPGNGVGVEPLEGVVNGRFPNGVPAPPRRPEWLGQTPAGPAMPTPDPGNFMDDPGRFRSGTPRQFDPVSHEPANDTQEGMQTGQEAYDERAAGLRAAEAELDFQRERWRVAKQRADAIANAPRGRRGSQTEIQRQIILDELKNAETGIRERERELNSLRSAPMTTMGVRRSAGEGFAREVTNFFPKAAEGILLGHSLVTPMLEGWLLPRGVTDALRGGAKSLREFQNQVDMELSGDPARREEFIDKLGSGGGSAVGFMLGGPAARAAGLSATAASGVLGGSGQAADYYREAEALGDKGFKLAIAYATGGAIGATEMFGIGGMLERMDKATGGGVRRYMGLILREAGEEAVQEATQQLLENAAKWGLHGQNVPITKDVAENALIGALLGAGMASVTGTRSLRMRSAAGEIDRVGATSPGMTMDPAAIEAQVKGEPAAVAPESAPPAATESTPPPQAQTEPQTAETPAPKPGESPQTTAAQGEQFGDGDSILQPPDKAPAPPPGFEVDAAEGEDAPLAPLPDTPEVRTLRAAGWADEDIAGLSPKAQAAALEEAANEGITDPGPSAEKTMEVQGADPAVNPHAPDAGIASLPDDVLAPITTALMEHPPAPDASKVRVLMSPQEIKALRAAGLNVDNNGTMDGAAAATLLEERDRRRAGTRAKPVTVTQAADVDTASQHVAPEPTEGQKAAGNYKMGHVRYDGLDISIETAKGGIPDFPAAYGRIKGTKGKDGDQVDIFLGDKAPNGKVFVIDQYDPRTGKFDEHKVVAGVDTIEEAAALYRSAYPNDTPEVAAKRMGAITELTTAKFKQRLAKGQLKKAFGKKPDIGQSGTNPDNPQNVRPPDPSTVGGAVDAVKQIEALGTAIRKHLTDQKVPIDGIPDEVIDLAAEKMLDGAPVGDAFEAAVKEIVERDEKIALAQQKGPKNGKTPDRTRGADAKQASPADLATEAGAASGPGAAEPVASEPAAVAPDGGNPKADGTDQDRGSAGVSAVSENGASPEGDAQAQAGSERGEAGAAPGSENGSEVGEVGNRSVEMQAGDADETIVVHLTREGPWDFTDTFPDVDMKLLDALDREGRSPFDKHPPGADEVVSTIIESLGELESLVATQALSRELIKKIESGKTEGLKGLGTAAKRDAKIKDLTKDIASAGRSISDIGGAYADILGRKAAAAMVREARRAFAQNRVTQPEGAAAMANQSGQPAESQETAADTLSEAAADIAAGRNNAGLLHDIRKPAEASKFLRDNGWTTFQSGKSISFMSPDGKGWGFTSTSVEGNTIQFQWGPWNETIKKPEQNPNQTANPAPQGGVSDANHGTSDIVAQVEATKVTTVPAVVGPDGRGWRISKEGEGYIVKRFPPRGTRGVPPQHFRPENGQTWTAAEAAQWAVDKAGEYAAQGAKPERSEESESSASALSGTAPPVVQAFKARLMRADGGFATILEARKFARENGFTPKEGTPETKQIEEHIEHAIALAAREIIAQAENPQAAFRELVAIYDRQPNLGKRTSASVAEQAYSTPVPLAYVASRLAGIDASLTVLEPTAGTGMLLIEADPAKTRANEINADRVGILMDQGFNVSSADGAAVSTFADFANKIDVVIANPPFGAVTEDGQSKRWTVDGFTTTAIDHAIVMNSLKAMKDTGRAVFIIGGVNAQSDRERSLGYTQAAKRRFFRELMKSYNLVDHFTVSGDLYKKQGAGWPVDILVIEGRKPSNREMPSNPNALPKLLKSWDEVGEKLNVAGSDNGQADRPADKGSRLESGGRDSDRPAEGIGNAGPGATPEQPVRGGEGARPGQSGDAGQPADALAGRPAGDRDGGRADNAAPPDGGSIGVDDVLAAFEKLYGAENPAPEGGVSDSKPARKPRGGGNTRPTPGSKAKEAAGDAKMGLDDIAKGLDALFKFDPTRFGSGPSLDIDPEKYAKSKVFFAGALEHFKGAAKNAAEALNLLVKELVEKFKFTREKIANMAPYIARFVNEWAANETKPAQKAAATVEEKGDELQAPYKPASQKGGALPGIFVPAALRTATTDALADLEKRVGSIDKFVAGELGFKLDDNFAKSFSQAQVDALGLAIDNAKQGKGFVLGDQTGIGKGRVVAGMIVWAKKQGHVPVFVTEKPDLYGDMWRDLSDILQPQGITRETEIFMTNSGTAVPLDDAAVEWKGEAMEAAANGDPAPPRRGKFSVAQTVSQAEAKMMKVLNGELTPDVVFTTYDQLNSVDGKETSRRRFARQLSGKAFLILDESHNAGGQKDTRSKKPKKDATEAAPPPRSAVVREMIANAKGVVYSSATFAKSPDVMDLYAATDMVLAVEKPSQLRDLIAKGGVPLQQAVASMLVQAGQYIRRERTFDGVIYDSAVVPIDEEAYGNFTQAIRAIYKFDREFQETREGIIEGYLAEHGFGGGKDSGVGDIAANSTAFSSIMHNIVSQMILSIKANAAAEKAIEAIEAGQKPIIALTNTMESFLNDFIDATDAKTGDEVDLDFKAVLQRYLARTRRFTIKDEDENKQHVFITDEMMPPEWMRYFEQVQSDIDGYDFSKLPISPIDAIRGAIVKAGYTVKEVTGRTTTLDYTGRVPVVSTKATAEKGSAGKRVSIREFNDGKITTIILNRSGSTGVSLHANPKYKDVRRRVMILLQSDPNPDVMMQMLGRPHRTGQVVPPTYIDLQADIPAEVRPAAIRMKKLASLNANTTASRRSKFSGDSPDFINAYGDKVVAALMAEDAMLNMELGYPVSMGENGTTQGAAAKVTGRLTLLEPERQQDLINTIVEAYNAYVAHLDEIGGNKLEAKFVDMGAVLDRDSVKLLKPKSGSSPFQSEVRFEKQSIKSSGRAMSPADIVAAVADGMKAPVPEGGFAQAMRTLRLQGEQSRNSRIQRALQQGDDYAKEYLKTVTKAEAKDRDSKKLEATRAAFQALFNEYPPGRPVNYDAGDGTGTVAIVLGIVNKQKGVKNPLALSNWSVNLALPDGRRSIGIPFSQINVPGVAETAAEKVSITPASNVRMEQLESQFEEARKSSREDRWFLSGNLLSGYDAAEGKGQIVTYSRDDGSTATGIIMPRNFNPDKFMAERPVRFQTGAQIVAFIDKAGEAAVVSTDSVITITKAKSYYTKEYRFDLSAGRRTGGKYFTDPSIRKIYDLWEKRGSSMIAEVREDIAARLIDAMIELDAEFETRGNQKEASAAISENPAPEKPKPQRAAPMAAPRRDAGLTQKAVDAGLDRAQVEEVARRAMEQILGPDLAAEVELRIVDKLTMSAETAGTVGLEEGAEALGLYHLGQTLIELSMVSSRSGPGSPREIIAHEVFHFMQNHGFFTTREIALMKGELPRLRELARPAFRDLVDSFDVIEGTAAAFGIYYDAAEAGQTVSGLHIGLRRIFAKIAAALRRIRNWAHGLGFQTSEDIFERARSGALARGVIENFKDTGRLQGPNWFANGFNAAPMARPRLAENKDRGIVSRGVAFWLDSVTRLREMQRDYERDAGHAPADVHGAYGRLETRIAERIENLRTDEIDPMLDLVEKAGGEDRVHRFLWARHAQERNADVAARGGMPDGGSGMDNATAAAELAALQAATDYQALLDAADAIYAMNDADLDRREAKGLLSAQQVQDIRSKFQFYVPLRGFASDDYLDGPGRGGQGISVSGKETRSALGRSSEADNIITQTIVKSMEGIRRGEKNTVDHVLLRLAGQLEAQYGTGSPMKVVRKLPMKKVSDHSGNIISVRMTPAEFSAEPDVVTVKVGGKPVYVETKGEVQLVDALKNALVNPDDPVTRALSAITAVYSKLRTAWNVFFAPVNFIRDMEDAAIYGTAKKIGKRNIGRQLPNAVRESWGYVILGRRSPMFEQFRLDGGRMSWSHINTIDDVRKKIERRLNGVHWSLRVPLAIKTIVENWNDLWENSVRFALYKGALDAGMTRAEAAKSALEGTLNFHRRGHGPLMGFIRATFPFISPTLQSPLRAGRLIQEAGGLNTATGRTAMAVALFRGVRRTYMGFFLLGLLGARWNYFAGGNDDDGIPFWDKAQEDFRDQRNLLFYTGLKGADGKPNAISIPAFPEVMFPYKLGASIAAAIFGKRKAYDVAGDVAHAAYGLTPLEGRIETPVPPVVAWAYGIWVSNKNWLGQKIHPEPTYAQRGAPKHMVSFQSTPQGWKDMAKMLNMIGVNLHPEDVRHIAREIAGGYYQPISWAAGDRSLERAPVARAFYAPGSEIHRNFERKRIDAIQGEANTRRMETKANPGNIQPGTVRGPRGGVNTPAGQVLQQMQRELRPLYQQLNRARQQGNTSEADRLNNLIGETQKRYRTRAEQVRDARQ